MTKGWLVSAVDDDSGERPEWIWLDPQGWGNTLLLDPESARALGLPKRIPKPRWFVLTATPTRRRPHA